MSCAQRSAGSSGARENVCHRYRSLLEPLRYNSLSRIHRLTLLAKENMPFAKDIVSLIEAQVAKAPASEKLPAMYLVDSIVKTVGKEYISGFSQNLVSTFVCGFEKADKMTRKSLFVLRSTWDRIFPPEKLHALDVSINSLDPAWPIKPLPPKERERNKTSGMTKQDPKLKRRLEDRPERQEEEVEEKRRCLEKREEERRRTSEHRQMSPSDCRPSPGKNPTERPTSH